MLISDQEITVGDRIITMPGTTFSKTWEITSVTEDEVGKPDQVRVELVDQAVGYDYATDDVTRSWAKGALERKLERGTAVVS